MKKLTETQERALKHAPLHYGQSEVNLNRFYWGSNIAGQADFKERTIDVLLRDGYLEKSEGGAWISAELTEKGKQYLLKV